MSSISARQHVHGSGGAMTMAVGVPGLFYMQKIFWAFIGAAIATATIANAINKILCYQRISARKSPDAAKPKSAFFRTHATLAAIIREFSSYSIPLSIKNWHIYLPTAGPVTIIVGYVVLIVVCCFYRLNPKNYLEFEDIGYRSGFIAVCQMPLIILLSSKRNIIGLLTGMGYERLNWLHRWTARCLLFTVIIHLGYWFTEWDKFDYAMIKIKTDKLTQRGITAGAMLGWIVFSSIAPIRKLSYEIFVIQHIISWFGFFVTLYYHIPGENRIWIWLPLGFWAFDRFARAVYMLVANLAALHKNSSGFLSCKATFEPLDDTHTRITIANPPITWQAGQHLFLTCHVLAPFTAHPFTIASLPKDGKIEFVVSAKKGATRKFFKYAKKVWPSLPSVQSSVRGRAVLIDGPYSRIRSMRQFDSIVLIAGSTGATFTVPLMRDVVQQWMGTDSTSHKRTDFLTPAGAVTRHIRFIWVVKKQSTIRWFATQLSSVIRDVEALREQGHDVAVEISIYVTCDETITSGNSHPNGDRTGAHVRVSTSRPESPLDEKKDYTTSIAEVSSSTSATKECCCTRILTDEDAITALCNCASKRQQRDSTSSTSPSLQKSLSSNLVDLDIIILAGRPHIPNIIRKTAELALGEMAVAVCGPPGLVQCTRNAVVGISDDRAVHKGTGAQGIYVHAEVFGYA